MALGNKLPIISIEKTGQKLKQLRIEHGYNRKELAIDLNTAYSTASAWETGKKLPCIDRLVALALLYNLHVEDLLCVEMQNVQVEEEKKNPLKMMCCEVPVNYEYGDYPRDDNKNLVFSNENGQLLNGLYLSDDIYYHFTNGRLNDYDNNAAIQSVDKKHIEHYENGVKKTKYSDIIID